MARRQEIINLSRAERLRDSVRQATSMSLPVAIQHRLDRLAESAKDVDATRAEIIGLLIANASLGEDLELEVLRYRKLRVGDVIPLDEKAGSNVISLKRRTPGRPARSGDK